MWAATSESLILMWHDSTANRLPDFCAMSLADGARAEAARRTRPAVDQPQARADDVRGVVHRDHPLPVLGPAVHVLRMRRRQVLDLAEFALLVHLLDEQELAAVDDRLGHHVLQAGLAGPVRRSAGTRRSSWPSARYTCTCLPALRAAIDIQAWSGIGELMWTKSTSGSASTSS